MKYRLTEGAEGDLEEVFVYWAERAGLAVADRLIEAITDRFWLIGEYPSAGHLSEEISAGVRCFPAGKYLIYYRAKRDVLEILHIFHGSRDQKKGFKGKRRRKPAVPRDRSTHGVSQVIRAEYWGYCAASSLRLPAS